MGKEIVWIALLCLTGCGVFLQPPPSEPNHQEALVVKDFYFTDGLAIQQVEGDYQSGLYRSRIKLRNLRRSDRQFEYQFIWYDQQGRVVNFDSLAWTPISLYDHGEKIVAAIAPNATVVGFKVNVRDAKTFTLFATPFLGKYQ